MEIQMKTIKSSSLNSMTEMDEPLLKEISEDSLMTGDLEIRATTGGVAMRRGKKGLNAWNGTCEGLASADGFEALTKFPCVVVPCIP
jgi:hypothetical protein